LDENGHCLAAVLLSVVILSLSGKPELLEQNACGTSVQKCPYPSMLLSGYNNGQECSLLQFSFLAFPITTSFSL
jgi:hypothetical protein